MFLKQVKKSLFCKKMFFYITISVCRLITCLPYKCIFFLGRRIGEIAYLIFRKERKVATINVDLCLKHLSRKERHKVVRESFISLGIGIMENAICWLVNIRQLPQLVIEGEEYLKREINMGNGIILLGVHQSSFELIAQIFNHSYPICVVYKERTDPFINNRILEFRERGGAELIPSWNVKKMLKTLRERKILWMVADQAPKKKRHTVFSPFFGTSTATYTSIASLATLSNSTILPISCYREQENNTYRLKIYPKIESISNLDKEKNALKINKAFERIIMSAPEQYAWMYKKFKITKDGNKNIYDR